MAKREIALREMQSIELNILKYLKDVCDENNLIYYLAYGTLIGAVRHHGFIPWDDDVDVMMPREDYHKLIQIMNENPHQYYKLISFDTNSDFTAPLPKIIDERTILNQQYDFVEHVPLGVYIDIFLLDGATDNINMAIRMCKNSRSLYRRWRRADTKLFSSGKSKIHCLLRGVRNIPYKIYGIPRSLSSLDRYCSRFSFYESTFVAVLHYSMDEPEKKIMKKEWFGSGSELCFEETLFRCPVNYDAVLRRQYGDYMVLPPKEQQVSEHRYSVTWK